MSDDSIFVNRNVRETMRRIERLNIYHTHECERNWLATDAVMQWSLEIKYKYYSASDVNPFLDNNIN